MTIVEKFMQCAERRYGAPDGTGTVALKSWRRANGIARTYRAEILGPDGLHLVCWIFRLASTASQWLVKVQDEWACGPQHTFRFPA